jgi:glycosyltransferase involved in cell wall biosynthesis
MTQRLLNARPSIIHFHDPEFMPWAIILKISGFKVIYDVHEDYPEALKYNFNLPSPARFMLPPLVRVFEYVCGRVFDGIVAATPVIARRFPTKRTVVIQNYPIVCEFDTSHSSSMCERPREVVYAGTINLNRNIIGILDAMELLSDPHLKLRLLGKFTVPSQECLVRDHVGWRRVKFDGWVSRKNVSSILNSSRAGLLVLKPIKHEIETLPIKLFEYMAAGLPVICSDFPLWRNIIDKSGCGLLVDPTDSVSIANAIRWILDNPEASREMGERGRSAVLNQYNWSRESKKLIAFYGTL